MPRPLKRAFMDFMKSVFFSCFGERCRPVSIFEKGEKIRGASWWGKISTAIFDVTVIVLIGLHIPDSIVPTILITVCSILMFLSFLLYAKQIYEMIKGLKS